MTLRPVSQPELERQRTVIKADFRGGWIPAGADQPQTLTAAAMLRSRELQISDSGV